MSSVCQKLVISAPQCWHFEFDTLRDSLMDCFTESQYQCTSDYMCEASYQRCSSVVIMLFPCIINCEGCDLFLCNCLSVWKTRKGLCILIVHWVASVRCSAPVTILPVNITSTQSRDTWDPLLLLFSLGLTVRAIMRRRIREEGCPCGGPSLSSSPQPVSLTPPLRACWRVLNNRKWRGRKLSLVCPRPVVGYWSLHCLAQEVQLSRLCPRPWLLPITFQRSGGI